MDEMIGHNQPPIDERANKLAAAAENWLKKVPEIVSDEGAARCRDFLEQVNQEIKRLEAERKSEKAPIIEAGKEIDAKYSGPKTLLEKAKGMIEPKLRAWLQKIDADSRAEAARMAAEARAAQTAAEAKAREAASAETLASAVEADRAAAEAKAAAKAAAVASAPTQVRGAVTGKASSLRTRKVAVMVHLGDAIAHYRNHPELAEVMTKLANADVRHGTSNVPGFRIETTQIAV